MILACTASNRLASSPFSVSMAAILPLIIVVFLLRIREDMWILLVLSLLICITDGLVVMID